MSGRASTFSKDSDRLRDESADPEVVIVGDAVELSDGVITALAALLLAVSGDEDASE